MPQSDTELRDLLHSQPWNIGGYFDGEMYQQCVSPDVVITLLDRIEALEQFQRDTEHNLSETMAVIRMENAPAESWTCIRASLRAFESSLGVASRRADEAEQERDTARETNKRLNERCQQAESAIREYLSANPVGTRNLGRILANTAAAMACRERDDAIEARQILRESNDLYRAKLKRMQEDVGAAGFEEIKQRCDLVPLIGYLVTAFPDGQAYAIHRIVNEDVPMLVEALRQAQERVKELEAIRYGDSNQ